MSLGRRFHSAKPPIAHINLLQLLPKRIVVQLAAHTTYELAVCPIFDTTQTPNTGVILPHKCCRIGRPITASHSADDRLAESGGSKFYLALALEHNP